MYTKPKPWIHSPNTKVSVGERSLQPILKWNETILKWVDVR